MSWYYILTCKQKLNAIVMNRNPTYQTFRARSHQEKTNVSDFACSECKQSLMLSLGVNGQEPGLVLRSAHWAPCEKEERKNPPYFYYEVHISCPPPYFAVVYVNCLYGNGVTVVLLQLVRPTHFGCEWNSTHQNPTICTKNSQGT